MRSVLGTANGISNDLGDSGITDPRPVVKQMKSISNYVRNMKCLGMCNFYSILRFEAEVIEPLLWNDVSS